MVDQLILSEKVDFAKIQYSKAKNLIEREPSIDEDDPVLGKQRNLNQAMLHINEALRLETENEEYKNLSLALQRELNNHSDLI